MLIHGRLLRVALRRWWILPRGLLWWWVGIAIAVLWKRLPVRAIQLLRRRTLATPDGVRRDERLRLATDRSEDTLL